jgi:hypothetical protein
MNTEFDFELAPKSLGKFLEDLKKDDQIRKQRDQFQA